MSKRNITQLCAADSVDSTADAAGSAALAAKQPRTTSAVSEASTGSQPSSSSSSAAALPSTGKHSAKSAAAASAAPKHPPLLAAAIAALRQLRSPHGSSLKAVAKQMSYVSAFDAAKSGKHLARAVKAAVASGILVQVCWVWMEEDHDIFLGVRKHSIDKIRSHRFHAHATHSFHCLDFNHALFALSSATCTTAEQAILPRRRRPTVRRGRGRINRHHQRLGICIFVISVRI
jgi:hypothetical protein